MKLTVRHSGREIELECALETNYIGYTDSAERKDAHVKQIIEIVKQTVEQVIKMNQ